MPPESDNHDAPTPSSAPAVSSLSEQERIRWHLHHATEYRERLLANIKAELPGLEALLAEADDHSGIEDGVYRFYAGSFKVYDRLLPLTLRMVAALQDLLPDRPLNEDFRQILTEGTGKTFGSSHNEDWLRHTRPIVEAIFHAQYFLRMACKYGRELDTEPNVMPSGWAALLGLFDLR